MDYNINIIPAPGYDAFPGWQTLETSATAIFKGWYEDDSQYNRVWTRHKIITSDLIEYGPPLGFNDLRDYKHNYFYQKAFSVNQYEWLLRQLIRFIGFAPELYLGLKELYPDRVTYTSEVEVTYEEWVTIRNKLREDCKNIIDGNSKMVGSRQFFDIIHKLLINAQPRIMDNLSPPIVWEKRWIHTAIRVLQAGWGFTRIQETIYTPWATPTYTFIRDPSSL